ncbi:DNA repair protein RecO (recombination protein O) [Natronobacillus azotifigens]|uniref:DNA repair protein RecO n=1 Tax=Natronobacillus azotifigens TaxID=472978 RepID=A0A9J6REF5_9BACI|nr:DNA repair protein RecO [Natronobacillus azotifigens]MCZ0704032.1 DNA repair protein RecO [Natronobacillus azotifigens]
MLEKIEGIIIRTQDYGETHKIITMFSKEKGKIAAIARGAKKPKSRMAAITQPFVQGHFLLKIGSGLSALQQGELEDSFRKIREDIVKTAYASYIAELTDKLTEEKSADSHLYQQLIASLTAIVNEKDPEIVAMMYELKLYEKAGFAPIVQRCAHCHSTDYLRSFSVTEGGLICQSCYVNDENTFIVNEKQVYLLQLFTQVGIERIANISVKKENKEHMKKIMEAYYEQYGGLYIKSKKFLKQIDLFK